MVQNGARPAKVGPDNPHGTIGGNALRAAVLGANDGLVSNLSLVMGVAGAELDSRSILITGIAGLLAGASSMAMGEWVSVQSSRELYARQIAIERREIEETPEKEAQEFVDMYMAKGLSEPLARQVSAQLMENPEYALDTMVREELGINPEDLGGSALEAAGASFLLFAVGAIVPVIPFLLLSGMTAVWVSLAASALALFVMGAAITFITGRNPLYSGARQLLFGMAAAGLTFAIGKLIGVAIAG
jgi:VIT1/CCC1 family predicted Fe2+/Mn2+ transporter